MNPRQQVVFFFGISLILLGELLRLVGFILHHHITIR